MTEAAFSHKRCKRGSVLALTKLQPCSTMRKGAAEADAWQHLRGNICVATRRRHDDGVNTFFRRTTLALTPILTPILTLLSEEPPLSYAGVLSLDQRSSTRELIRFRRVLSVRLRTKNERSTGLRGVRRNDHRPFSPKI